MSNENPTITAMQRDRVGTRYSRRLRQEGKLPAVIYGHGSDPMSIAVDSKETLAILHHGAHVLNIAVDGASTETCLVKDLQFGYLGDDVVHVDFARVNLDETVQVLVRLEIIGEVAGAKSGNAIMITDLNEIEVSCAVRSIPEFIRVDLGAFEDSVNVGELTLPEGVTAVTSAETSVIRLQVKGDADEDSDETTDSAAAEKSSDS
jgi:large subunit ribosomal protein L25